EALEPVRVGADALTYLLAQDVEADQDVLQRVRHVEDGTHRGPRESAAARATARGAPSSASAPAARARPGRERPAGRPAPAARAARARRAPAASSAAASPRSCSSCVPIAAGAFRSREGTAAGPGVCMVRLRQLWA